MRTKRVNRKLRAKHANKTGSAYVFVLVVMLALFLLLGAALGVTAVGMRLSRQYARFAGLHNLALAGVEQAYFLLRAEAARQAPAVQESVRQYISQAGLESQLIFQNGQFLLHAPTNARFLQLYQAQMAAALRNYTEQAMRPGIQMGHYTHAAGYYFYYEWAVPTGLYDVLVFVWPAALPAQGFNLRANAAKTQEGHRSHPTAVLAELRWPARLHEERVLPLQYAWRYGPPPQFADGLYMAKPYYLHPLHFDYPALPWSPDQALHRGEGPIDVRDFRCEEGHPLPTLLMYTGPGPLQLHAGAPEETGHFYGLILAPGGVSAENILIHGAILTAGGGVTAPFIPDPDILFAIPLPESTRRAVFDFLGLTRFEEDGPPAHVLRYLQITHYEIEIYPPLYDHLPTLQNVRAFGE